MFGTVSEANASEGCNGYGPGCKVFFCGVNRSSYMLVCLCQESGGKGVLPGSLREELDGVHVRCIFRMPGGGFHCTIISFSVMLAPRTERRAGGGDAGYVASGWICALPPSLVGLVRDELGHSMSHLCPPHVATSGGATIVEGAFDNAVRFKKMRRHREARSERRPFFPRLHSFRRTPMSTSWVFRCSHDDEDMYHLVPLECVRMGSLSVAA